jgi:sec-independent protein translocase protein TatB
MFDIGFPELLLVSIVTLLVLGPERLPESLRTLGLSLGRMRRSFTRVKTEIEREIGMDEVRRQLHEEAIMEQMKKVEQDVKDIGNEIHNLPSTPTDRPIGHQRVEPSAPPPKSEPLPTAVRVDTDDGD